MLQELKNTIRTLRDSIELAQLNKASFEPKNCRSIDSETLAQILACPEYIAKWNLLEKEIHDLYLPENTGGVNVGDQRAIINLLLHFKPESILEIGTHIGCSTVHLAIALRELNKQDGILRTIDTVDIKDVNDPTVKPWVEYLSPDSPKNNIEKVNAASLVNFINCPSIDFLRKSVKSYDFIFLDGSHSANVVYQELPLAAKLLNKDGIILLHDYFPGNRPLWNNHVLISGPYLACKRLQNEGNDFKVVPLGSLPWFTKVNSNITSLALVSK
jgi:predicted O-methyltransferase YrrM